jgi:hypothetical protein
VCFAGGFLVGEQFVKKGGAPTGNAELQAKGAEAPRPPGFVDEVDTTPLADQALIVAAYPGLKPAEAKASAKALAEYLRSLKFRAKPYEYAAEKGVFWVVAVYFDGDTERIALRERLRTLPAADVPDAMFVHFRNVEPEWPVARRIQIQ